MERGQSSNNKNKGKAPVTEEEDIGDDNNANPSTTIVPSGTDGLGLALVLAPQGTAMEEGSGATSIISRMRREELAAEGSNPRKRKMHKCKYCEKEFSTSQALGGHQNAHKPERVEAKLQESLGKMGATERDHINISGRYQPYHFYPTRNIFGGPSLGVPPRGQPPLFQSFPHSFPTAGLGSGSRFPMSGQIPPPANSNTSGQGFSERVRTWREFLTKPNNSVPTTSGAGPSNYFGGLSHVGSDMGDGRKLNYYPGGIGFGPRSLIGTYNANMNLFGQNFHHYRNPIGNMHPNTNPATNANPNNNVGADVGVAAAPPANDRSDNEDGGDEGEEELDLTLKL